MNRAEILGKMHSSPDAPMSLSDVLDEILADVTPVAYGAPDADVVWVDERSSEDTSEPSAEDADIVAIRDALLAGEFGGPDPDDMDGMDEDQWNALYEATSRSLEERLPDAHQIHYIMQANDAMLKVDGSEYEVWGIRREESERFYLLGGAGMESGVHQDDDYVNSYGLIVSPDHFVRLLNPVLLIEGYDYIGSYINGGWVFCRTDRARSHIALNCFDMVVRLFSRNTGLLESTAMNNKKALIIGCGSVGSLVANELARAGVGHFILVDSDILEVHNICRHQLGFRDLGRYKVDAVRDAILNINPLAEVMTYRGILQDLPADYVKEFRNGIIVGTGDNRESSGFGNDLARALEVPFIATCCWTRAHAGEVFYWYPGAGLPLYREAFADLITDERPASHRNYFADDYDERTMRFEPGISTDIAYVTTVAIKLIYDLLNKDSTAYTTRVRDYLKTNYTLICNTNDPNIGGPNAAIFPHPLFISNNVTATGRKGA